MQMYNDDKYPIHQTFKYPKVGEKMLESFGLGIRMARGKAVKADIGDMIEMYIPRMKWTQDASNLCVFKMNRHRTNLNL
ncbi:MAG: DPP IV N-terminal domain-containing protein [Saprospiraceae bacterium]|nr:DPP IV N-terminal domain-containing protein [Saprospiraceae bacterium]